MVIQCRGLNPVLAQRLGVGAGMLVAVKMTAKPGHFSPPPRGCRFYVSIMFARKPAGAFAPDCCRGSLRLGERMGGRLTLGDAASLARAAHQSPGLQPGGSSRP